jgi:hypothetical protein
VPGGVFCFSVRFVAPMDPFSDESLRKFEEWRRANSAASQSSATSSLWGYAYRGCALGLLYALASMFGYPDVPAAMVIVAIVAYYCGQATAKGKRS